MERQNYSNGFKKSVVEKLLRRGSRSVASIIEECGVAPSTLYKWANKFANVSDMEKTPKSPQNRSAAEKLNAIQPIMTHMV